MAATPSNHTWQPITSYRTRTTRAEIIQVGPTDRPWSGSAPTGASDRCSRRSRPALKVPVWRTIADAVDEVMVRDNGHGFVGEDITDLFGAVGGSWKHHAPS